MTPRANGVVLGHVAGRAEDLPRLVAIISALRQTGAFRQSVIDLGAGRATQVILSEFDLRTPVLSADDVPEVPDDVRDVLVDSECAVLVVHVDDHAGLCAAIAAARLGIAVVRVGGVPTTGAGRVIARLADVLLTRSPHDAAAQPQVIAPERSAVIGDPLAEMIRRHSRAARDRAAWRDVGAKPGAYVLALLSTPTPSEPVARELNLIAAGDPIVSPRVPNFLERLSLERGARAIVTDSERVQQEAATLRVPCHVVEDDLRLTAHDPGPGVSPIVLWDARAGELAARALVTNFACVRLD